MVVLGTRWSLQMKSVLVALLDDVAAIDITLICDQCGSGHESAGEVVEVGEGVTQWKVGEDIRRLPGLWFGADLNPYRRPCGD